MAEAESKINNCNWESRERVEPEEDIYSVKEVPVPKKS